MKYSQHIFAGILLMFTVLVFLSNKRMDQQRPNFYAILAANECSASTKLTQQNSSPEIINLRNSLAACQIEILQLREQIKNLTTFRNDFLLESIPLVVPCSILVRNDSSDNRKSFKIDRGSKDGIKLGNLVVFGKNLLGRVWEVGRSVSTVLQVTDPTLQIPILLVSSNPNNNTTYEEGICMGNGDELCKLKYIEKKNKIEELTTVITSGLSTDYPKGLVIGEVIPERSVQIGQFWNAYIQPIDLNTIHTVLVFQYQ